MKETLNSRKVPRKCEGPNLGVGSIGKVRVLMMQELDSLPLPSKPSNNIAVPVSVYCFESSRKGTQTAEIKAKSDHRKTCKNSSNGAVNATNNRPRSGSAAGKKVGQFQSLHRIPMLESEDIASDQEKTPIIRGRTQKFVNVVDLKYCGNINAWFSEKTVITHC